MVEIVATNVVNSRPPNGDRLQRRPLVPIDFAASSRSFIWLAWLASRGFSLTENTLSYYFPLYEKQMGQLAAYMMYFIINGSQTKILKYRSKISK